jgi:hypothetical protein
MENMLVESLRMITCRNCNRAFLVADKLSLMVSVLNDVTELQLCTKASFPSVVYRLQYAHSISKFRTSVAVEVRRSFWGV